MKKEYTEPRVEKVEFNYEETVTASDGKPPKGNEGNGCRHGASVGTGCDVNV